MSDSMYNGSRFIHIIYIYIYLYIYLYIKILTYILIYILIYIYVFIYANLYQLVSTHTVYHIYIHCISSDWWFESL